MLNVSETQPPQSHVNQIIDIGETIPPRSSNQSRQGEVLSAGESIADSYVINALMNKQGKQSNVYLAKKWGKTYVVKVYHSGWRPSNQLQSYLASVRHPNIAHVVESGEHEGDYFEIYEYYSEGTLESVGALSGTHIQNILVPSINEGLHELHRNGIIHCDIKPSNLFYSDNGKKIVIGDCGISEYTNSNGKLVDTLRGTPEYAPRVKALLWSASMSSAYDYGSFGLVLCKAILGHSIFEGMSIEEISKAWEIGLDLPSQINGRLGILIRGLLNEDEDQRWGYVQVKQWCEGEYMRSVNRSIYPLSKKYQKNKPLIFGRYEGQTVSVTTLHQLAKTIKSYWKQASRIVKRRELIDFVQQFDKSLVEKIKELSSYQDPDEAVFKLLIYIEDNPQQIFYCGKSYESLSDYVDQLSTGKDEIAKKFLLRGLLVFYLRYNDYEQFLVDRLEQLIRRNGSNDMELISTVCFALQGEKSINLFGVSVESLDALIPILSKCSIGEIDGLLQNNRFIAWLRGLGFEKEIQNLREAFV